MSAPSSPTPRSILLSRTVVGIVLATFFSDVGHEMVTAVLPLYLASVGLGPAALGLMEGAADLLFSLSKLAGGVVGHRARDKRALGTLGYLATAIGTAAMGFARGVPSLIALRAFAWIGRGFRSPLRDFLLSDAVPPTHFGRVYGVERSADMLGAVTGPLIGAVLLWLGADLRLVIFASLGPSLIAAASFFFLTKNAPADEAGAQAPPRSIAGGLRAIPRAYWIMLGGVFVFGLGDFSRSFLVLLAVDVGKQGASTGGVLGTAVILYSLHNAVSAVVAYPVGHVGDKTSKLGVLAVGYLVGALTNVLLATTAPSIAVLAIAMVLSGATIAVEETIEKAACAELLPRDVRSLGLGVLAATNALGDMLSSVFVGWQLERGQRLVAFGVPAALGLIGAAWIALFATRRGRAKVGDSS